MTKLLLALLALLIAAPALAQSSVRVKGYIRKDGTYVAPHYRTAPDRNPFNNFSARGNINPYTGTLGTVAPAFPMARFAPLPVPPAPVQTPTIPESKYAPPGLSVPDYIPPIDAAEAPADRARS